MAYNSQQPQMQVYTPQQAVSEYQRRRGKEIDAQSINQFKQASGWSGQGNISQDQYNRGMQSFGFTDYLNQGAQNQQPQAQQPQSQSYSPEQAATQFQSQYGRGPTQQDIQRFQSASGWSGQGNISQQQMQEGMRAMGGFMQQEGNLGAVPFAQVSQPGQMQTFDQSRQQGQQLVGQYQPTAQTQQFQNQAGQTAMNLMQQGPMQFQQPSGGPMPDFGQQQNLINYLVSQQGPQSNQGLFNQQQQSINAMQGMQAGAFQTQGGGLLGQAVGQAGQMMNAGPLVNQFQTPEQIAQTERNRTLQAIMGSPDVFGSQQQAQMAEQQKEQLLTQQREAEGRLGQMMAQRGLSARGGADLAAQMGLQENLISGLMAGQRDIALRAAEANRAARLDAVNAVTGAQQADLGMASQAYQTGLQGAQANRAAQTQATQLGAQLAGQEFGQGLQAYQAGLEGQQFNLAAQQAAQQAAGALGGQQFQQGLAGAEFTRGGMQAALTGSQNLAQQQMQQNQQGFGQNLAAFNANLAAQGQFGNQQLNAAQLANQMGQQGFQNYLAQAGLGLQGFGAAEAANAARAQFNQGNYMDALRYNLAARGQEQDYGMRLRDMNTREQEAISRIFG